MVGYLGQLAVKSPLARSALLCITLCCDALESAGRVTSSHLQPVTRAIHSIALSWSVLTNSFGPCVLCLLRVESRLELTGLTQGLLPLGTT